jgi:hypothetical protein
MCDPRVDSGVVRQLREAGIKVVQRAPTHTGLGTVVWIDSDTVQGLTLSVPHISEPFSSA